MEKLKNKIVLIVDDEERNLFALSSYLETLDMFVRTARNGEEALSMINAGPMPDIVLLDMMMPVMDGFETLAAMKKNGCLEKLPVLAVTAKAMKGDKEKCLEAGAWDYLSKPVDIRSLIEKMERYIS